MSGGARQPPAVDAARELVALLVAAGVREFVLSPGSRSAPLAHALAAAEHGGLLRLHVRVDERAAGFLALGLARGARVRDARGADAGPVAPVAVVTTSGTAVANLHPAVLEAHHGAVPLLVLSADRPHELWGTGANQTTPQAGLFAGATRLARAVPAPSGRTAEADDLRSLVARACATASGVLGSAPGPVHLDLAYREPLSPEIGGEDVLDEAARDLRERVAAARPVRVVGPGPGALHAPASPRSATEPAALAPIPWQNVRPDERGASQDAGGLLRDVAAEAYGVVLAGDGAGPLAARLAEARGWPLLAEITSGAAGSPSAVRHHRTVIDERPELLDDVRQVVVLGRPTLSRQAGTLVRRAPRVVAVAPLSSQAEPGWPDPERAVDVVLADVPCSWLEPREDGDEADAAAATTEAWRGRWLAPLVQARPSRAGTPTEGGVGVSPEALARALLDAAGEGVLVVGSSNPVRDLDEALEAHHAVPTVVANRGLAGIDGLVSTAVGVALALGEPVRALLGDLTFLHDVGGLWRGEGEEPPRLQLVVANDRGGSIFAGLEHGLAAATGEAAAGAFRRVFTTPHEVDLGALCAAYGVVHSRVRAPEGLTSALSAVPPGLSVLEVDVMASPRPGEIS